MSDEQQEQVQGTDAQVGPSYIWDVGVLQQPDGTKVVALRVTVLLQPDQVHALVMALVQAANAAKLPAGLTVAAEIPQELRGLIPPNGAHG